MKKIIISSLIILASFSAVACQTITDTSSAQAAAQEATKAANDYYISHNPKVEDFPKLVEALPQADWKSILPPPPENSTEIAKVIAAQGTKSGALWDQSRQDNKSDVFKLYQPILGSDFTAEKYPETAKLLEYAKKAHYRFSSAAKKTYDRVRPVYFDEKNVTFCAKDDDKMPHGSSYPSGHTAWGWTSAQILARLYPTKADAIFTRGREYGEHRVVCGAHYPSDVVGGRITSDVTVQRLEGNDTYINLFNNAKAEIEHSSK